MSGNIDRATRLAALQLAFWQAQHECSEAFAARDDARFAAAVARKQEVLAQQRAARSILRAKAPIQPMRCIPVL